MDTALYVIFLFGGVFLGYCLIIYMIFCLYRWAFKNTIRYTNRIWHEEEERHRRNTNFD
jgi:hypothetical protein